MNQHVRDFLGKYSENLNYEERRKNLIEMRNVRIKGDLDSKTPMKLS